MCGGGGGAPKVERRDIRQESLEADREATKRANAEIARRKSGRRRSSLIANTGGASGLGGGSAISVQQGSDRLG